jgi:hypothetical protein
VTTIAAMRDALAALGPAAGTAAAAVREAACATRDDFALWPPAPAEHGPNAARRVAQALADAGEHSHLAAYGETVCLSRQCGPALDALRGLL